MMPGRGNAGFDVGQNDVEERVLPRRAEAASRLFHRKIEIREAGGNHAHDVGNRQQRMADQQAGDDRQIILIDHVAQHDETEHDARNQHRREEDRLDRVLALEIVPIQRVSRGRPNSSAIAVPPSAMNRLSLAALAKALIVNTC